MRLKQRDIVPDSYVLNCLIDILITVESKNIDRTLMRNINKDPIFWMFSIIRR